MSAKARRILALLKDPRHRERLMQSMNRDTMDEAFPIGGDQEMKVLQEMNELGKEREQIIRDSVPKINVL